MRHSQLSDEIRETAALFSLGALGPEETRSFEEHLRAGCSICEAEVRAFRDVTDALADLGPAAAPPDALRARLLERLGAPGAAAPSTERPTTQVWKEWDRSRDPLPWFLLRAGEGSWEETGVDGVRVQRLFVDAARQSATMLVKMAPGTSYPTHRHAAAEECYVLSGDLHVGDVVMRAGDYQRASSGTVHGVQSTEEGCTLLIVSSLHDELIG